MSRLCIISHTEHYRDPDGSIVGLSSTVQEINALLNLFDQIVHVAVLHPQSAPQNTMAYASERIQFVALPPTGGSSILKKIKVLYKAPLILSIIRQEVKNCDVFQFRAPTGIGVFVLPWLIFVSKNKGWYKYAGNWQQPNAPLSYRFQRWLLSRQSQFVTINGVWPDQPKHCLSFENPCLTDLEFKEGQHLCASKTLQLSHIELCFVGRLEVAKGIELFIKAILAMPVAYQQQIAKVHIVGEGTQLEQLQLLAKDCVIPIEFYGLLSRGQVHNIYKQCHVIVLPSASEGFPKVIAEAMNYGCVPIVSNVSALGQYIQHRKNGFLITPIQVAGVQNSLEDCLSMSADLYTSMIQVNSDLCSSFTYAHYLKAIQAKILGQIFINRNQTVNEK